MLSPSKLAVGVVSIGVTGSVGIGSIVYLTQPKERTIEDLLKVSGLQKTLLVASNKDQGTKAWNKYKTDKANDNNDWKISDWDTENSKDIFPASLIKICETRKQDKVKRVTDTAYINFISWCTVESI